MLKSYFKIALRNLQKQKGFTFINVFGLSVGIACFSLLLLFAFNQFSFDKFHKNAPHIYRAYEWDKLAATPIAYTQVYGSGNATLGESMKQQLPDVIDFTRLQLPIGQNLIRTADHTERISLSFADPSFFTIFSFSLTNGNTSSALHGAGDIVITESRATNFLEQKMLLVNQ